MNISVTDCVVVTGSGPDRILLHTTLPDGCWPYEGKQTIKMEVAAGTAEEYLKKNLGFLPFKIVRGCK
jgi:hypothetical protein